MIRRDIMDKLRLNPDEAKKLLFACSSKNKSSSPTKKAGQIQGKSWTEDKKKKAGANKILKKTAQT